MSSDHEAEIRASVAAHQDLGPGYDDAVAGTAIVSHHDSGGRAFMVLLIWIVIAIVNIAYARRL